MGSRKTNTLERAVSAHRCAIDTQKARDTAFGKRATAFRTAFDAGNTATEIANACGVTLMAVSKSLWPPDGKRPAEDRTR
jgi:hypothetical protein